VTGSDLSTFDRIAVPYDRGMAPLERLWLREMRSLLLPIATGDVLEIGVGTGANLPFYADSVCLTAVDESLEMLAVATQRASHLDRCVHFGQTDAEHLAFPAERFDTVVASLLLCSVLDQSRALQEFWRVLRKPGGQLLLLEHMRPRHGALALLADLLDVPWHGFNGRCHLNRRTEQAVANAGFQVTSVEGKLGGLLRLIVAQAVEDGHNGQWAMELSRNEPSPGT
jgi:ubiquinone/menaquinone biosynthesis C-methylase UbiE